jgi:anti-anti-sigma factor
MPNESKLEILKRLISEFDFGSYSRYSSRISAYELDLKIPVLSIDCEKIGVAETSQMMKLSCDIVMNFDYPLVFDISECRYISSFALGAIAKLARHRGDAGLCLIFAGPSDMVRDVIKLSNLEDMIEMAETVPEALKSIHEKTNRNNPNKQE